MATFFVNGVEFLVNGPTFNGPTFNPTNCFGASPAPWCLRNDQSGHVSFAYNADGDIPIQAGNTYTLVTLPTPARVVLGKFAAPVKPTPNANKSNKKDGVPAAFVTTTTVAAATPVRTASPVKTTTSPVVTTTSPPQATASKLAPEEKKALKDAKKLAKDAKKFAKAAKLARAATSDSEDEPLSLLTYSSNPPSQITPKGGKRSRNTSPILAATAAPPSPKQQTSDSDASAKKKTRTSSASATKLDRLSSDAPILSLAPPAVTKLDRLSSDAPILAMAPPAATRSRPAKKSPVLGAATVPVVAPVRAAPRPQKPHPKRPSDDSSSDE